MLITTILRHWTRRLALLCAAAVAVALSLVPASAQAAFPGDSGKIAFATNRDGNFEIYVMDNDGSQQTNLTNNATTDLEPAWSPDGSKLAFASTRDGNFEVYVMNADGSGLANLTNNPASDREPAWSPDGSKLAFRSGRDGDNDVHVMNADGSGPTNLTSNPAFDVEPAWSPDGSKIAFMSNRDGSFEVHAMNADGSGTTNLTNNPFGDREPDWSPGGLGLVFASDRDGNDEVYTMNADGSGQTNRTSDAATDFNPAPAPDGSRLAFSSNRDGDFEIYLLIPSRTAPTNLTGNPGSDIQPDWQPLVPVNSAPSCSAVIASPTIIEPATRDQMKTITLSGATDPDSDPLSYHIDGVTQDELVSGSGVGDTTAPDAQLTAAGASSDQVLVRAERNPKSNANGRVYRIAYTVSDGNGGSCSRTAGLGGDTAAKTSVPRKRGVAAIDDGNTASWNSFSGAQVFGPLP